MQQMKIFLYEVLCVDSNVSDDELNIFNLFYRCLYYYYSKN